MEFHTKKEVSIGEGGSMGGDIIPRGSKL